MTREDAQRQRRPGLQVVPAVDVLGGDAVRLVQGDFARVAVRADPEELARRFASAGAPLVHVVDLEGARSGRVRPDVVARLASAAAPAAVQASGGIRSRADADALLEAGAARVVVGTAALGPALAELLSLAERLVVALDVRGGRLATRGWTNEVAVAPVETARRLAALGVRRFLCTAIDRDGTLRGPDLDLLARVCGATGVPVLAAGGIRSPEDLRAVATVGCEGAIVGRALLDGGVPLSALAPRYLRAAG